MLNLAVLRLSKRRAANTASCYQTQTLPCYLSQSERKAENYSLFKDLASNHLFPGPHAVAFSAHLSMKPRSDGERKKNPKRGFRV